MTPLQPRGLDPWEAWVRFDIEGPWTFRVEGWSDPWGTWLHNAEAKLPAGVDIELVCLEGRDLFERTARTADEAGDPVEASILRATAQLLIPQRPPEDLLDVATGSGLAKAMRKYGPRELVTPTAEFPVFVDRKRALFASWYEFFPRSEGATYDEATDTWTSGTFDSSHRGSRKSRRWASTSSICRRSTRSARRSRRARTTPSMPTPTTRARRGPSAAPTAATTRSTPTSATGRASTGWWPRRRELGHRDRARLRAAGLARPPVGHRAPRVVHHPPRRHHRLRREPAEEVPGHLPDQLRQRPRGHLQRGAAHPEAVDEPRRPHLPRRQPAHQAGAVLGLDLRPDPRHRPRRAVLRRGLHQARDDARAGQGRLPHQLHVLHLARHQGRARGVHG